MTNYIILALCVIIILAYIFDITCKFSKIPGVILLIALGMLIRVLSDYFGLNIPDMKPLLPVIGTLGLIMIVMEASLDIDLNKNKRSLIFKSVSSALVLLIVFVAVFAFILTGLFKLSLHDSILNAIPFAIISSSVAIPSAVNLLSEEREFVVYESSFSDILGIMAFEFILLNQGSLASGLLFFIRDVVFTLIIALVSTAFLGYLLHKISYHVNYVIILTFVILIYAIAELIHLPALLLVLVFGLVLSNHKFLEVDFIEKFIDFTKFSNDINNFNKILGELTFLVRSFFFIMFGFYTDMYNLFNMSNILTAVLICSGIFGFRWIYFKYILRLPPAPLFFFAPRGLITILLFLSIPVGSGIPMISDEVVTLVILITIIVMMNGNFFRKKRQETEKADTIAGCNNEKTPDLPNSNSILTEGNATNNNVSESPLTDNPV